MKPPHGFMLLSIHLAYIYRRSCLVMWVIRFMLHMYTEKACTPRLLVVSYTSLVGHPFFYNLSLYRE